MTAYHTYSDQELLDLLSKDNRQAFDMLYIRHWESMYKTAFLILRDTDACKDIIQDIFIWLWEHRHSLEVLNLVSYLRAAVKFKVANYLRSGKIRESVIKELANIKLTEFDAPAMELIEFKQFKAIVSQAISDLPDKCREIFQLSREEQMSNREIAEKLQISVKTVENQMTIALRRVRQAAEPHLTTATPLLFLYFHHYIK